MYLNSYVPVCPEPAGPDDDEFNFLVKAEHSSTRDYLCYRKKGEGEAGARIYPSTNKIRFYENSLLNEAYECIGETRNGGHSRGKWKRMADSVQRRIFASFFAIYEAQRDVDGVLDAFQPAVNVMFSMRTRPQLRFFLVSSFINRRPPVSNRQENKYRWILAYFLSSSQDDHADR